MLVADVAIATGIGPADLLASPPGVFEAIIQRLQERQQAEEMERRQDDLRSRLSNSIARG